ncbi:hypothetical protein SS50377_27905 [Spironucleus salmonicida]|uniref:Ankyrin repeat-containing protein n=1 Tax=Spironucleus salmonicida TaxID=348837 RepID=V6LP06_9EUKA|nr:hypothetical protein SS50377_27905 [Spironucleus salmonicida]|eukprot:EST42464.1 Hypothetical protein SS50377_17770 [Spironucleus salmonicida]
MTTIQLKFYEKRKFSQACIYPGFLPIHYACAFKSIQILELLLNTQVNQLSKFNFFSSKYQLFGYQVKSKLDALQICVFGDFQEGAELIISYIVEHKMIYKNGKGLVDCCLYANNFVGNWMLDSGFACQFMSSSVRDDYKEVGRFLGS